MPDSSAELLQLLYLRPGFLLRRAHQLSVGLFEEGCRELSLTPPQYGLQTRGLVARKPSTADGRCLQLTLTADGVATLTRGRKLAASVTERLMAPLAGDEREQFKGLLRKLCAGLEPKARTKLLPPGC